MSKGAAGVHRDGRRFLYSPTFTRDEWLRTESIGFVDKRFGGRVAPLVAHFAKHRKLTKSDLADLKRLIAELDGGE